MSTSDSVAKATGSARRAAWDLGGLVLVAAGIGSLVVGMAGLIVWGGGVAFFPLAVPPLAAGYAVLRRARWARVSGFIVALAYAATVAYVATTPWRGLTPPDQSPGSADPGALLLAVAFVAAAILVLVGTADRRTS
jgi:hypothetical protein